MIGTLIDGTLLSEPKLLLKNQTWGFVCILLSVLFFKIEKREKKIERCTLCVVLSYDRKHKTFGITNSKGLITLCVVSIAFLFFSQLSHIFHTNMLVSITLKKHV